MLIICTKYILRLIRWQWLLRFYYIFVNKEKLHHFRLTQFSVGRWSKCNIFSLDLLKTYAIFLHYDRHFSWQYFSFERDTQFWYTDWGRQLYNVYMVWMSDIIFTELRKLPDDFWRPFLYHVSQSHTLFLSPASHIQLTQDKLNCLFFCCG